MKIFFVFIFNYVLLKNFDRFEFEIHKKTVNIWKLLLYCVNTYITGRVQPTSVTHKHKSIQ